METRIGRITLLVHNYDTAIEYYVNRLGFTLLEDTIVSPEKRWVRVAPSAQCGPALLLAKATTEQQKSSVGNQAGGRVFLFLHTPDFKATHLAMLFKGVVFKEAPRQEAYGQVAVFEDLYGNLWDLIEAV